MFPCRQHLSKGLETCQSDRVKNLQKMKSWPTDEANERQHSKENLGENSSLVSQIPKD